MTKMHIAPPEKRPHKRNRLGEFAAFVFTIGVGLAGAVVFVAAVAVALSLA